MRYSKPALSINAQLRQLKRRGLTVTDHATAKHYLRSVGYYRLEGYWWTMQRDAVRHLFRRGSTFADVVTRYNCDRELRLIALNMIERVEIGVRTQVIYHLAMTHGPFWFEDPALAKHPGHHAANLRKLEREVRRSQEKFIVEHRRKYHRDPRNPPAWKSLEVVSFGLLSKMYRNLDDGLPEKTAIAANLGLPTVPLLENWLHAIALLRNVCAHHSRLIERVLTVWPNLPARLPAPWMNAAGVNAQSAYADLCCLQYLLHAISPDNRFPQRLTQLQTDYPSVNLATFGFPANWQHQALWKS